MGLFKKKVNFGWYNQRQKKKEAQIKRIPGKAEFRWVFDLLYSCIHDPFA